MIDQPTATDLLIVTTDDRGNAVDPPRLLIRVGGETGRLIRCRPDIRGWVVDDANDLAEIAQRLNSITKGTT
jgi:hypothetical protein